MSKNSDMSVYLHADRNEPTFLIPITDGLFLVWIKREGGPSEWSIKNIEYIKSMRQKYPTETTYQVCKKSPMLQEATPLEVLIHTGNSIEEVKDIFLKHQDALKKEGELAEN